MGDTEIKIYSKQIIDDGYGGRKEKQIYHSTISCELAPITTKLVDANGRVMSHQILKIFSETKINLEDFIVEYNGKNYKKYSETDYTEIFMYELELV